jgi:hypothetical protein
MRPAKARYVVFLVPVWDTIIISVVLEVLLCIMVHRVYGKFVTPPKRFSALGAILSDSDVCTNLQHFHCVTLFTLHIPCTCTSLKCVLCYDALDCDVVAISAFREGPTSCH